MAAGTLTAQVLFAERAGRRVLVDVVVLDCGAATDDPPIGSPLCFALALPRDRVWCDVIERRLRVWATQAAIVTVDQRHRLGRCSVRIVAADTSVTLEPASS